MSYSLSTGTFECNVCKFACELPKVSLSHDQVSLEGLSEVWVGIFLCALCERRVSVLEFQSPLLIYSALKQRSFFVQLIS